MFVLLFARLVVVVVVIVPTITRYVMFGQRKRNVDSPQSLNLRGIVDWCEPNQKSEIISGHEKQRNRVYPRVQSTISIFHHQSEGWREGERP